MADPEGSGTQHSPRGGGGAGSGSFWTSAPGLITAIGTLVAAITGLIVGLSQAGIIGGGDNKSTATTTTTPGDGASRYFLAMTAGQIGRVYFEGETMLITALRPGRPYLATANVDNPPRDVQLEVDAKWVSGARDYGIALVCRYENAANYYLLSVLSGSRYNIVKYRRGKPISLKRGTSDEIDTDMNNIRATCFGKNPTLTLKVNGEEVGTVQDPNGIEAGNFGIRVGSAESRITCSFDGFELKPL